MHVVDVKIQNNDIVFNGSEVQHISGDDALLQQIKARLTTKKGSFYPNKNFGSYITQLSDYQCENGEQLALQHARQALLGLKNVCVLKAQLKASSILFIIKTNHNTKEVEITL